MRTFTEGYPRLSMLLVITTERLLFPALIAASLTVTGWLVSLLPPV